MIKKLILILTIFISFALANNLLESKITKLQTVPKAQRYKLMNQIKRELAKMNATQRSRALKRLKESMHSSNSNMQHGSKDMGSHMQNSTKHMLNKAHLHEHSTKPKKPHKPNRDKTHKTPDNHQKPEEHKNPNHQKGSYVKQ